MKKRFYYLLLFAFLLNRGYAQNTTAAIKSAMDSVFQSPSNDWIVTSQSTDNESGLTHAYVQQKFHGIPVYNAISILVLKNDKATYYKSGFIENIKAKIKTDKAVITASQAVNFALKHLGIAPDPSIKLKESNTEKNKYVFEGGKISNQPIQVELVYTPNKGNVLLSWNVSIDLKGKGHWWNVRVDATNGDYIEKNDYVAHCSFDTGGLVNPQTQSQSQTPSQTPSTSPAMQVVTEGYRVFPLPVEAPTFGSRQLLLNPADPIASPFGWHDTNGIPGAEYSITRGNNVYAYEDQDNDDQPGYSPDGTNALVFDFPLNLSLQPASNMDAALTNLFYMNNTVHDKLNYLGFAAADGNFQENNYGSGGDENDAVQAEGFDGGGTDNANFATPPDGANPRMQMYLWAGLPCGTFTVNSPGGVAGTYTFGAAGFNPAPSNASGDLILVNDGSALPTQGCYPIVNSIAGKIAVVDRGSCLFIDKVLNAQAAGAIAVIIINNQPGVFNMSGFDPSIVIPTIMVSQSDGAILKAQMLTSTVNATIDICTSILLDGSLDNGIIAHEYGHGVSNRLTGGPLNTGCLDNGEQGGEGWSDWLALMLTIEPGDNAVDARNVGSYASAFPATTGEGLRFYPYSTDMSIDPHTYGDLAYFNEAHFIGEIWCSALWDMSWLLMNQYGYNSNPTVLSAGNNIAIRLVLEGMKLQPCGPGFLDARDAILQADHILYNDAHRCLIWQAFSRRGMGYYADQGSADYAGDEIEDFSMPPAVQPFASGGGSFCLPSNALLDAGPGWLSYTWSTGQHSQTIVPAQFGTYSVTVTGLGCDLNVQTGTAYLTVSPSFDPVTSATPPSLCPGGSSQLKVSAAVTIGTGTLTNSIYSSPAPYGNVWTSEHEQYLILASELSSQGLSAGNITSLSFDVVTQNSGPGSQNLNISMAHTNVTNLTNTFISTGFSSVYSNPYFTSTAGWNEHAFTTPFNWDGVSNVVVDVSMMNCSTCPATPCVEYYLNDIVHLSSTPFVSCTYTFDDGNCTVPSYTPTSHVYRISLRPNMIFKGVQSANTYLWTPSTFLNNTGISNPVAGNVTNTVVYNVKVTRPNGCYANAQQKVEVTTPPPAPGPIQGRAYICKGESGIQYCVDYVAGAIEYIWTLPTGVTLVGPSNGNCITVNFSTKFKGGNICVKARNTCFTGQQTCKYISLQGSVPPKPSAISGTSPVCLPAQNVYCINAIPTADSYVWSITGNGGAFPMTILAGQGSTCILVDQPLGYNGNQKISVRALNCKGMSSENTLSISVIKTPSTPGSISGPTSVCKSNKKSYSVGNVSGATYYTWSVTNGATIFSGQGTNSVQVLFTSATSTSAVLSVIASNTCGSSLPQSKIISVNLNCKIGDDGSADMKSMLANDFVVYPNPTSGKITLSFNLETNTKIVVKVLDLLGNTVLKEETDAVEGINQKDYDLSGLAKGVYFIHVGNTGRNDQNLRIVIE